MKIKLLTKSRITGVGLLLTIMSALTMFSCSGGGDDHTSPRSTYFSVKLENTNCTDISTVYGTIKGVSINFETAEIVLTAGKSPVSIEVPDGGAYTFAFHTTFYGTTWDFTKNAIAGATTPVTLVCN